MKKIFMITTCLLILVSCAFSELLDYTEKDWPATCKGKRNSPIDFPSNFNYNTGNYFEILRTEYKPINDLKFQEVKMHKYHIANLTSGYGTLYAKKNGIEYKYDLIDVHFHILSEHTFGGKAGDFELHMVHQKDLAYLAAKNITDTEEDKVNKNLVVGTLFKADASSDNADFEKFKINTNANLKDLNLKTYSRPDQSYYHYIGGLTTPACDEVVNWVVNTNMVSVSARQNTEMRKWITALYPNGNARMVQDLNGRTIYRVDKVPVTTLPMSGNFLKVENILLVLAFMGLILI